MTSNIHPDAIQAFIHGNHGSPFDILGNHADKDGQITIRAFRPHAQSLQLIEKQTQGTHPMTRIHELGLFEVQIEATVSSIFQFEETTQQGVTHRFYDPYQFAPVLTDYDIYLLGEGKHYYSYEKLGAHIHTVEGVTGVLFAVWAPNAYNVSVTGNFNGWDDRIHPMRQLGVNGIWELFIPGLQQGDVYKFSIRSHNRGYKGTKTDPYGFYAELRPNTASIVYDLNQYEWGDDEWLQQRAEKDALKQPMSIYELHPGSWRLNEDGEWLNYRELADQLVEYLQSMNYTHIELMPVAEHPLDISWGYQVVGYYAPTSRYGTPDDFMYFVDKCHQNNIGIILDWVPAHFPKDGHGLSYFDGTHLYSHADPRQGEHPDWGTYIFNYGRNEVRNFLISNALFWMKHYHIDGLRVDAVSSMLYLNFSRDDGGWIPNKYGGNENLEAIAFLKEVNEVVHQECPGIVMIAEESTAWPMVARPTYVGGLGFTMKWNMGWMHDTLDYMKKEPIYRSYHHHQLTFSLIYAFSENFVLSLSHDEVVHGKGSLIRKMSGDEWQKFANLRLLFGYQYMHPGKKLNFMGQEFAQWSEWNVEAGLDWQLLQYETHSRMQQWVRDLNAFYQSQPALYEHDFDEHGFQWIEADDYRNSVFVFLRFADNKEDFLVVACNFTPNPQPEYRIGVPYAGEYEEILNSDSEQYGGANIGNHEGVSTEEIESQSHQQSIRIAIPPLGLVVLRKK